MDFVLTFFTWVFFGSIAYYVSKLSWYLLLALWSWRQDIKSTRAMCETTDTTLAAAEAAEAVAAVETLVKLHATYARKAALSGRRPTASSGRSKN